DPKPAKVSKSLALRTAINKLDKSKAALGKAAAQLLETESWLKMAQEKHDRALEEAGAPVDPELFANLEDYTEEGRVRLRQFQTYLGSLATLLDNTQNQYKVFTEAKKAADAIHAPLQAKKRKAAEDGTVAPEPAAPVVQEAPPAHAEAGPPIPPSAEELQQRRDRLARLKEEAKAKVRDMDVIIEPGRVMETHVDSDSLGQTKVDVASDGW
ncbi:unnamed protein product, partial [Prorocentrum cordatum]